MRRWVKTTILAAFLSGLTALAAAQTDISAQLTFTTIDVPGAGITVIGDINDAGDMVGYYSENSARPAHAFLLRAGVFTFFDYPGADQTRAMAINNLGLIVGQALKGTSEIGFTYDGTTFASIRVPGKSATVAWGVNDAGDIVGGDGTLGATRGFELHNGRFKLLAPSGDYVYVYATGINNSGKVVGWTSAGLDTCGFFYFQGKYRSIVFPGSTETEAWRINDSDIAVGWYGLPPSIFGFLLKNGKYATIAHPGSAYTLVVGINNAGQTVGSYTDDKFVYHGFVTSPVMGLP